MRLRPILKEPLIQFLVLGTLLFLYSRWRGGGTAGSNHIAISSGQIASIAATFEQVWTRPPTDDELKALVDEFVREEIAVREATAMGLDQGDVVIRRRLRQKFEFLAEDVVASTPPTDADLQAWLDSHRDQVGREPLIGLRQVFIDTLRHGARARDDAGRTLVRLRAGANPRTLGDPTLLPFEVKPSDRRGIAAQFGDQFASGVADLAPGQWTGPIESTFGLHLVYVTGKSAGNPPTLDQVRREVTRELLATRRAAALESLYQLLARKYRIAIERAAPPAQ